MSDEGMRYVFNAIALVCYTALAIAFNKWGFIFLSAFFWSFKTSKYV
jgi:hypothetical protein